MVTKNSSDFNNPVSVVNGGTGLATLTAHSLYVGEGTSVPVALGVAGNGVLPIGSIGADPVLAALTGTANQVVVTNGAGSITLSTPQSIGTGSSPTFAALTLSSPLTVANGGTGLATLTAHSLYVGEGTSVPTALGVADNGQIPIGSVGADPVLAALTGTSNQVVVTNGAGSITLSTPQSIGTASAVQFGTLQLGTNPASVSASNPLSVGYNNNSNVTLTVSNTTAGTSSVAGVNMVSDTATGLVFVGSSTVSTTEWQNFLVLEGSTSADGVVLDARKSTGVINFRTNTALAGSFDASQVFTLNNSLTFSTSVTTPAAFPTTVAHGTTPLMDLYHNAATVANDFAYEIDFNAQNSTPAKKLYGSIQGKVLVNTASAEYGQLILNTINNGSSQANIVVGNNLGQYRGTQTNTAAPAGFIGEVLTQTQSSSQTPSSGSSANIAQIDLTAGNWLITGNLLFFNNSISTYITGSINTTTDTLGSNATLAQFPISIATNDCYFTVPTQLVSVATTTTHYLVAAAGFTGNQINIKGTITAVRIG